MKKIILKMFYLAATISCKSPNYLRVGDGVDILIANILIRGYLLPAITNFRNLSNKTLMIVSIDFPHHASLPGSKVRLTLCQFSPDSLFIDPLIMLIKEFLLKIVGMVGVAVVVV